MKVSESGYELDLKVDVTEKEIELVGTLTLSSEEDDVCTVLKVDFAADITPVRFTREDVLTKLYKAAGIAAGTFGPLSDAVDDLQEDIDNVKNGASLAPYSWLFE